MQAILETMITYTQLTAHKELSDRVDLKADIKSVKETDERIDQQ